MYLLLSIVLSTISLYIIYFLGQGEGHTIIRHKKNRVGVEDEKIS